MNSCVMSIYGFYSTNLVLRRPETSATDKSHFCSFDAPSVYLSSFSVRRPIGFRPPSDQIPNAARPTSRIFSSPTHNTFTITSKPSQNTSMPSMPTFWRLTP